MSYTFDESIKIGDYVFSSYHDDNIVFIVKNIKRRILDERDIKCSYTNYKVGDEINPLVEIEPFIKLNNIDNKKKIKIRVKSLDGGYLRKISIEELEKRIQLIQNIIFNINEFKEKL